MIDTLLANREKAKKSDILKKLGVSEKQYGVITLHRPSNVDDPDKFEMILRAFNEIQKELKLVFPIHPRSRKNILGTDLENSYKEWKICFS
jgi:UDP-N-acetylglucosamine 2-epimerase (non-hydrolysing)